MSSRNFEHLMDHRPLPHCSVATLGTSGTCSLHSQFRATIFAS